MLGVDSIRAKRWILTSWDSLETQSSGLIPAGCRIFFSFLLFLFENSGVGSWVRISELNLCISTPVVIIFEIAFCQSNAALISISSSKSVKEIETSWTHLRFFFIKRSISICGPVCKSDLTAFKLLLFTHIHWPEWNFQEQNWSSSPFPSFPPATPSYIIKQEVKRPINLCEVSVQYQLLLSLSHKSHHRTSTVSRRAWSIFFSSSALSYASVLMNGAKTNKQQHNSSQQSSSWLLYRVQPQSRNVVPEDRRTQKVNKYTNRKHTHTWKYTKKCTHTPFSHIQQNIQSR